MGASKSRARSGQPHAGLGFSGLTLSLAAAVAATSVSGGCRRSSLPPKPDGAAVVVMPDEGAGDVPLGVEKEPNDAVASAMALAFGEDGTVGVKGELDLADLKAHAADVYELTIPPPPVLVAVAGPDGGDAGTPLLRRRLSVALGGDVAGLFIEALDDKGGVLMTDTANAGEEAAFPNWSVLPGTYFVRVRLSPPPKQTARAASAAAKERGLAGAGGAGAAGAIPSGPRPYRLVMRLGTPEPGDEAEPNGKATLAQPTTADDEIAGYFGWRRDEDWYRVALAGIPEGNLLSLDLSPVPGVAAGLAIFDAAEHRLVDRHGRKDEALALRDLAWSKGAEAVYVVVRAESGKNAVERYRLRVRNQPSSPETEVEPNDDAAHALPLAEGNSQGTLGRGDVDMYRFKIDEARVASLEVTPPERVDVKVDVLREGQGAVVAHLDQGKRQEPEAAPNLFLVPGSYLVKLTAGSGDGNPDEPYRLALTLRSPDPGEEREPNDAQARATLLSPGSNARGWLAPKADVDLWRFDQPAGAPARSLKVEGLPDLSLEVKVLTAAGKEVARANVAAGGAETVEVPVQTGACCFIQIREKSGKLSNSRESYGLAIAPL